MMIGGSICTLTSSGSPVDLRNRFSKASSHSAIGGASFRRNRPSLLRFSIYINGYRNYVNVEMASALAGVGLLRRIGGTEDVMAEISGSSAS